MNAESALEMVANHKVVCVNALRRGTETQPFMCYVSQIRTAMEDGSFDNLPVIQHSITITLTPTPQILSLECQGAGKPDKNVVGTDAAMKETSYYNC